MKARHIPLVDLKRQYRSIRREIDAAIKRVIKDTAFISGKYAAEFEAKFARYVGVRHCVALASGTDALYLAYLALGVGRGDEVISPPNTFFATTEPLGLLGAKPVFADIDPRTHLVDPGDIERKITKRTKAIVVVHLYGQMADMPAIMRLARRHKLAVIEDAAQAHGATFRGKKAGTFGDVGVYSFYPGKNLGAYGDAGALVTNNAKIAEFVRKCHDHGRAGKYEHEFEGISSRMDGIQAAILSAKLPHLDRWVKKRREIARAYDRLLPKSVRAVAVLKGGNPAYHLYVIETDRRNEMLTYLKSKRIEAGIHYPIPLHRQKAYARLGVPRGSLPHAERAAKRVLSLPIFPELTLAEIRFIVSAVREFFD